MEDGGEGGSGEKEEGGKDGEEEEGGGKRWEEVRKVGLRMSFRFICEISAHILLKRHTRSEGGSSDEIVVDAAELGLVGGSSVLEKTI